jgi:hypothetical protein
MLDGRKIIEVSWESHGHRLRTWLVWFGDHSRVVHQAVRSTDGQWYVANGWEPARAFPSLPDVRRHLFRGNGRLTGGHAEIGERGAVRGRMSPVNVQALCDVRTAPGGGDYWS